jgi:hypothetical protein
MSILALAMICFRRTYYLFALNRPAQAVLKMLEEHIIDRVIMKPWGEAELVSQIKTFLAEQ